MISRIDRARRTLDAIPKECREGAHEIAARSLDEARQMVARGRPDQALPHLIMAEYQAAQARARADWIIA